MWAELFFKALDLAGGVQPGVIGNPPALGQLVFQPVGKLDIGPGHRGVVGGDLLFHLGPIPPVDEDPRDVPQGGAEARRSGKAREPGETFIAWGDIFALMGVGAGDQEPIQPVLRQLGAQRGEPRGALLWAGGHVE